jgi:hypothetical protein
MKYTVEASCAKLYISSFIKIGTGVQATLRFCFRNSRGCNFCITVGRDLRITPLGWVEAP